MQLVQLSNPTVAFCCNLLTHDEKGQRWRESERPPRSAWMPVLISVQPLLCDLTECVFISHKERPWVIQLNLSALTETITTLCITLHQDAVRLVRRRTCRLNLDEEKIIARYRLYTPPHSHSLLFLSNSTFCLPHSHCR